MKWPEPKTFRGAMSPVTVIKWALGIGTFEYPAGCPRRFISLCWSGTILILFLCSVKLASVENVWDLEQSVLSKSTLQLYLIAALINGITMIYLGQVRSKSVVDSFCKLERVNEMLNMFGIPKEYGLTYKSQIIHLAGILPFFSVFSLSGSMFFDDVPVSLIGYIICVFYVLLVSFCEEYTFSSSIRYIARRFRHLNKYLGELSMKDENAPFLQGSYDHISWIRPTLLENHMQSRFVAGAERQCMMRIIQNAKKIHHDLCKTAINLNEAFGVQIILSMAIGIIGIIVMFYDTGFLFVVCTTTATGVKLRILGNLTFIVFCTIKILHVITACSMASAEAHDTGNRMLELVNSTTSNEIREEIHAFVFQLMHDPLRFTACGFFTLDETMIRAMIGTVITHLVFMIQSPHTAERVNSATTNAPLNC